MKLILKLLFLFPFSCFLITGIANSQLPANPWEPAKMPEPVIPEVKTEPQVLTYDAGLPVDPWSKFKKKEPTQPRLKDIPKVDGLSINPIDAMIQKKQQGGRQ